MAAATKVINHAQGEIPQVALASSGRLIYLTYRRTAMVPTTSVAGRDVMAHPNRCQVGLGHRAIRWDSGTAPSGWDSGTAPSGWDSGTHHQVGTRARTIRLGLGHRAIRLGLGHGAILVWLRIRARARRDGKLCKRPPGPPGRYRRPG
jgi:hypothetical protein